MICNKIVSIYQRIYAMNFFKQFKKSNIVNSIIDMAQKQMGQELNKNNESTNKSQTSKKTQLKQQARIWKTVQTQQSTSTFYAEVLPEDAASFIQNIVTFQKEEQIAKKNQIRKQRIKILQSICVEPIYMQQNQQQKILKMQLESNYCEMEDRYDFLVSQQKQIQVSINQLLSRPNLWGIDANNSISNIYCLFIRMLTNSNKKSEFLTTIIRQRRNNIKIILQHILRCKNLINKRKIYKKKIQLLKKVKEKSLKNSVASMACKDIDQAFYIERQKQKLFFKINDSGMLFQKLSLFQDINSKIKIRNKQLIQICSKNLKIWAQSLKTNSKEAALSKKHIEKLLILVYFLKNERMYSDLRPQFDLQKVIGVKNVDNFIVQLNRIKQWKPDDFKYVNNSEIRKNVVLYIDSLSSEIKSGNRRKGIFLDSKKLEIQK